MLWFESTSPTFHVNSLKHSSIRIKHLDGRRSWKERRPGKNYNSVCESFWCVTFYLNFSSLLKLPLRSSFLQGSATVRLWQSASFTPVDAWSWQRKDKSLTSHIPTWATTPLAQGRRPGKFQQTISPLSTHTQDWISLHHHQFLNPAIASFVHNFYLIIIL